MGALNQSQMLMNEVDLSIAYELIKSAVQNDLYNLANVDDGEYPHTNICLHGSPGVGKSAIVKQIARELNMGLVDLRISGMDESAILGVPYVFSDGLMYYSTPQWWPKDGDTRPYILFLDELMGAKPHQQVAALRLLLDRSIHNGKKLPDNWIIIAAGNLKSDKTGAGDLLPAASNRFGMHLLIDKTKCLEPFLDYAVTKGFNRHIVGFLSWKKEAIYGEIVPGQPFATPRTWESVNRHMNNPNLSDDTLRGIAYASAVGSEKALQFKGYLETVDRLPDWEKIKAGDEDYHYTLPVGELCVEFQVGTGLAYEILESLRNDKDDEIKNLCGLVSRLGKDIKVLMFKTMNRDFNTASKLFRHNTLRAEFDSVKQYIKR